MKKFFLLPVLLLIVSAIHVAAQSPCESFTVRVEALSASARFDTLNAAFLFCPETAGTETFRAIAGYSVDTIEFNPAALIYTWTFGDDVFTGREAGFSLEGPGAYPFVITVEDPLHACSMTLDMTAKVGTYPDFTGTVSSVEVVCAEEFFALRGVVAPVTWTRFSTSVVETAPIPEERVAPYESSIEFDVFGEDQVIDLFTDFDRVCVVIDHVDFGQVKIELECPDGALITLKDFGEGGANLGEPVIWDDFTPGKGYQYCFSSAPMYGTMEQTSPGFHAYADNAGNYYFNAAYMPAGSYTPDETLQKLTGCPLNGKWTIRVMDQAERFGSNGFMHGWSLYFDESFYPDSLMFTPVIVSERWYRNNTPLTGNPAPVSEDKEGEYTYRFEVEDNFGCRYDTLVTVKVLALPEAEIISDLEMPVCEGDSTYLRVQPLFGTDFDWVYQWRMGAADLPDRIFDTILAREPGTYSVVVVDTLTGCQAVFDFNFDDQNCELVIPNVFTPNADGVNDVFEIKNLEHYPVGQIVIYNRWGKKVFEHNSYYNNWWDGQGHPDGVYFYVIKYERLGKVRFLEGSVTIIR